MCVAYVTFIRYNVVDYSYLLHLATWAGKRARWFHSLIRRPDWKCTLTPNNQRWQRELYLCATMFVAFLACSSFFGNASQAHDGRNSVKNEWNRVCLMDRVWISCIRIISTCIIWYMSTLTGRAHTCRNHALLASACLCVLVAEPGGNIPAFKWPERLDNIHWLQGEWYTIDEKKNYATSNETHIESKQSGLHCSKTSLVVRHPKQPLFFCSCTHLVICVRNECLKLLGMGRFAFGVRFGFAGIKFISTGTLWARQFV